MRQLESVPVRAGEVRWRSLEGTVVLIDQDEGELVRFNEIGSRIWEAIDGQRSSGTVSRRQRWIELYLLTTSWNSKSMR